ncbi:aa3-type cytochrome c oxidase subunit IV [Sphingomonas donggukensis]|uniref:Aa3-type cytochrome c oxidase subunit IV n=1 Tax=Sphingomonas donggukensis TaxID=2949093 RepID=A0ABY4TRX6_9SPHN|nr:aa3-type cytochrome c oxidase subunit IV [Sphingomonas donggukensis]URW75152.1 aa3-type cytochrome c oxidase subunit IV [Sphingomonas donggukensis]
MAEHSDMKAHLGTYTSVMAMLKWGAVICFLIGAGVVWLIAS